MNWTHILRPNPRLLHFFQALPCANSALQFHGEHEPYKNGGAPGWVSCGFTLIELLLYVSIVGSLLLGMTLFFGMSVDARVKNQTISEVNQQGSFAMDVIAQTIRNATSITLPLAGASGSSLTLVVPTGSLSPTVFDVSGGTLRITEGVGSPVALTSSLVSISSLTVTNLTRSGTPGIVQVSFTLDRVNPSGRAEYSFSKTFTTSVSIRP